MPISQMENFRSPVSEAVGEAEVTSAPYEDACSDLFSITDAQIVEQVCGIMIKAVSDIGSDICIEPFEKPFSSNSDRMIHP